MSAIELSSFDSVVRTIRPSIWSAIVEAGARLGQAIDDRRTVLQLAKLQPRQLHDMGFDADAIYRAAGTRDMSGIDFDRFVSRR